MSTPSAPRALPPPLDLGLLAAVVALLVVLVWLFMRDPAPVASRHQLERVIAADVRDRIGQPVQVSCSANLPARKGAGTWCMVRMANGQLDNLHVTDLDAHGDVTYTAHPIP